MKKGRKHTKSEIDRILRDIRSLQQQNVPANQIRHTLGIELRQYQYFTRRINQENQEMWRELVKEEVATELFRLRDSLEASFLVLNELWKQPGLNTQDKLAVLRSKDNIRSDLCNLLVEGTEMISNMELEQQPKKHKIGQNKLAMQPHP